MSKGEPDVKIYISARYTRRDEAEGLAIQLRDMGHIITSRWVWRDQPQDYESATHEEVAEYAQEDIEDVLDANHFVTLSESSDSIYGRGGRHVEFGLAISTGIMITVIGPRENIFHYLFYVNHFDTSQEFLQHIKGIRE